LILISALPHYACMCLHRSGKVCHSNQPGVCQCFRLHNLYIQRHLPLLEAPIVENQGNEPVNAEVDMSEAAHRQRLCELFNSLFHDVIVQHFKSWTEESLTYCFKYNVVHKGWLTSFQLKQHKRCYWSNAVPSQLNLIFL